MIRNEQFQLLSRESRRRFETATIEYLRQHHSSLVHGKTDDDLHALIETGLRRAKRYGVMQDEAVRLYLTWMLRLGTHFDVDPTSHWAGQLLRTARLTGMEKVQYINKLASRFASHASEVANDQRRG
jgi:hypothetical protein